MSEHRDPTCRLLHIIGTSLLFLNILINGRSYIPNFIIGISCGLILCEFLSPLSNGLIEFISLFSSAAIIGTIRKHKQGAFPWYLLAMGYLPAWIGHFFFERNRPATFIYPTYSMLCDFIMWAQSVTGQLPLRTRLD